MKRRIAEPPSSEITPEEIHRGRREILRQAGLFALTSTGWGAALVGLSGRGEADPPAPPPVPSSLPGGGPALRALSRETFGVTEVETPFDAATTYNNYYELGLSKTDPARLGHLIRPRPWTVLVTGEVERAQTLDLDAILSWFGLEERVYRMRCVEAWSMVIPWLGFPLGDLVKRLSPTSRAKYVELTTLEDHAELPGQEEDVLPWPYVEALRIDEAMNPLAFLAVGIYGRALPGQNGAPLRLVVPWKYGFKGAKSIVRIRFTENRPRTTWNRAAPAEYGFYANVNPLVDHPRWSQATERRIGEIERRRTLPYNGYARYVADLYRDLDLRRWF